MIEVCTNIVLLMNDKPTTTTSRFTYRSVTRNQIYKNRSYFPFKSFLPSEKNIAFLALYLSLCFSNCFHYIFKNCTTEWACTFGWIDLKWRKDWDGFPTSFEAGNVPLQDEWMNDKKKKNEFEFLAEHAYHYTIWFCWLNFYSAWRNRFFFFEELLNEMLQLNDS